MLAPSILALAVSLAVATDSIRVVNPTTIHASSLAVSRVPVGIRGDYKPSIALMPDGELLLVLFQTTRFDSGQVREDVILHRSRDGGKTWTLAEPLPIVGREPYLTILRNGTIFITTHLLAIDVRNSEQHVRAFLHRSTDGGRTWTSLAIEPEGVPPEGVTLTSRNVLRLSDGTLLFGLDAAKGPAFLWRSKDDGVTWTSQPVDVRAFQGTYSFFEEAIWYQAANVAVYLIRRADANDFPIDGRPSPPGTDDTRDHLILYALRDGALQKVSDIGDYGEMYPSVLPLSRGNLLLTFTVRDLKRPLGVQAVLGSESADSLRFDFDRDRLIIDARTPDDQPSGGGFGPTVMLADGTLVTAYSYRAADGFTYVEVARWQLPRGRMRSVRH